MLSEGINVRELINQYLERSSEEVFNNANKYLSPTGLFNYVTEGVLSSIVGDILPREVYEAHLRGVIYVHKLPYSLLVPYCCGHSIRRVLLKGLRTPTIYSRPAKHFNSFVDQIMNYLTSMQQYFSGAQSLNAVELYSGPFIKVDGLSYREVKQGVQRLLFNLNFPSRVGMQTPFTNFTLVLDAAKALLEGDRAIHGGKEVGNLGNYLSGAKLFVKALAELFLEGDGNGAPFTFPILTLMTTSKVIFEDPELFEAIFRTAAARGSFYWLNTRVVDPNSSYAMCCRIAIDRSELLELVKEVKVSDLGGAYERALKLRKGGIWALPDITGSIGVITVNLPRIAFESEGDEGKLTERLGEVLRLVKKGLDWMRESYCKLARNYPGVYSMPLEYVPEVFSLTGTPFFSTVGLIGLPEMASIMIGDPSLWAEPDAGRLKEALKVMERVLKYVVSEVREWSLTTGIPYNVEEVPGETAAIKLAKADIVTYPQLSPYVRHNGAVFYSSSIVPYYAELELPERMEIESRLQGYFTGGVMMHIFLGEEPDPEALAKLVKKLTYHTKLMYWSFTPAFSMCRKCGWRSAGLYPHCPKCGSETEIWSRVIGYYRPLSNWYPGRREEFWTRKHYRSVL